ncbi:MAG: YheT family hydrolase [Pseudomonadales bacterium]
MLDAARPTILQTAGDVQLEARLSLQPDPAPGVILIHGWLGHADSSYVLSAAAQLWNAGFSVVRLNLRDHGDTAHLNEEMFHSARIDEVVSAVELICRSHVRGPCGLAGFSLGGNFALRVARAIGIETVAICPAVDPPATMTSIDTGLPVYKWFFLSKWRRALAAKQRAFPHRYDFSEARKLPTVSALTEQFVRDHTGFASTAEYFDAYSLTGDALEGTQATVVYAMDDPVIPAAGFTRLPTTVECIATAHGGHCAFIERPWLPTWTDGFLVRHFEERLAG